MADLSPATVAESGIEFYGKRYFDYFLRDHIGEEVLVGISRYQPGKLIVHNRAGKFICFASLAPEVRIQRLGCPPPLPSNLDQIHRSMVEGHQELIRRAGSTDPKILADYANRRES